MDHNLISIVIACYNEAPHLAKNITEIERALGNLMYHYEFIIIDDCSQDNTRKVIHELCGQKNNYHCYFHERNVGRGGTVREGLLKAKGKYAGYIDIDLEVHARYIPSMITALDEGFDAALGYRFYDFLQSSGKLRAVLSLVYRLLVKYYLKINIHDTEVGYKFFNLATTRNIIFETKNNEWFWDTEIVAKLIARGKKIKEIPCLFLKNTSKPSSVKLVPVVFKYLKELKKLKMSMRR